MNRGNVIAWLSSLTDKQFVEFFYDAVANRDSSEVEGEQGHLVLADTRMIPGEKRETVFLGLPYPQPLREWADNCPLCQTGDCNSCGAWVRCIAKHAVCPICFASVYCT